MQDLKRTMRPFGRSCSFVSGNALAASTIPKGTTAASGSSFPSLSEPPQSTQTLGKYTAPSICLLVWSNTFSERHCFVQVSAVHTLMLGPRSTGLYM